MQNTLEILNKNLFFVKEHIGLFKAANNYDIYDPQSNQIIMECREPDLGGFTKILRFTGYKQNTPFNIVISPVGGNPIIRVKRGVAIFRSTVMVYDENNIQIGWFKQKLVSLKHKFTVFDNMNRPAFILKGNFIGWEFTFTRDDVVLGSVSKKWAGFGKEMFTTADNYMLQISDSVPKDDPVRKLILAAVMCIDMVIKEK
jgi:uncharacterized protein YxjI